jgi:hypothetical protein
MAWNITIHEHVLTGTDQEFYFALQGIDMYAGKWNAAYYNMLKTFTLQRVVLSGYFSFLHH